MFEIGLILLALVVHFSIACELWLGLKSEECFVKLLVVDVELAHLRLDALSLLLFEAGLVLLL